MKAIDYYLNRITMYKLLFYVLIGYVVVAALLGFLHVLHFSGISIIISTLFLVLTASIVNKALAKLFKVSTNIESAYITALILALIITPAQSISDFFFLGWAAVIAMGSKYILAYKMKHVFNPAAIAVVITAFVLGESASWWIGTGSMLPFVLIGGFLIIRKVQYENLFWTFFITSLIVTVGSSVLAGQNGLFILRQIIFDTPIFFFSTIMLTEPLTLPPTKNLRTIEGILVGFLFTPAARIGHFAFTPELALITGNIYAYLVSPKQKLIAALEQKLQIGEDIIDFAFRPKVKIAYKPGQYMEWTLPHTNPDSRGNRRYFTLASSPTEDTIRLGVKFYKNGSSFKNAMEKLNNRTQLIGGQLSGDFILPSDKSKKLIFMAGGIGITPFRSMIQYLIDKKEKRDIILFYSNKTDKEIAYKDVFDKASRELGIKTIYVLTEKDMVPAGWKGLVGRVGVDVIAAQAKDYKERIFYLSGPLRMVDGFEAILLKMGIKKDHIKRDFFPGLI